MLVVISRNGQIPAICQAMEINSSEALKECVLIIKKKIIRGILVAKVADTSTEQGKDKAESTAVRTPASTDLPELCRQLSMKPSCPRCRGLSSVPLQKLPARWPISVTFELCDLYSPPPLRTEPSAAQIPRRCPEAQQK